MTVRGTATAAKLTELEQALIDLAHAQQQTEVAQQRTEAAQQRTEANLDRLEANLDRNSAETKANLDRISAETKANLDRFIAENERRFNRMATEIALSNKNAGDAINRSGRLVEDIVAPGIRDLFRDAFHLEGPIESAIRIHRGADGREFDAFAAGGDHFLLVSAKGTVAASDVIELLGVLARARDYFPEARDRKVHGAMASLYVDPSVIAAGERRGLLMVGLRPGLLTILNSAGFAPGAF